jgi:hypothetical protein
MKEKDRMSHPDVFDLAAVVEKYNLKEDEQELLKSLIIDESQQECIANYDQRTLEWKLARVNRLTASKFGAARGHCEYTNRTKLLADLLWSENFPEGNIAMKWGVDHEAEAVGVYTQFMRKQKKLKDEQFRVTHSGLLVSLQYPWIGVSVDAFVFDDSEADETRKKGGAEIKCPYGKKLYPFIPSMYFDQIQGSMGFLHRAWWDFVVWTPSQTQVRRFNFDQKYFDTELFPRLQDFYMTVFLPRAVLKKKGLLQPGRIDPVMQLTIELDSFDEDNPEKKNATSEIISSAAPMMSECSNLPKFEKSQKQIGLGCLLR